MGSVLRAAVVAACLASMSAPAGAVTPHSEWTTLGGAPERSFYNGAEHEVTAANVQTFVPKWRFPTVEPVTASPAVATVDVNGVPTDVVFDADFAGNLYAVDANTGLPVWETCLVAGQPAAPVCAVSYPTNPGAQVDYGVSVGSPAVADVSVGSSTERRVFEAADAAVSAVDASTGAIRWTFSAAGDPADPHHNVSNNYEIEASPLVVSMSTGEQVVIFSIDCNAYCPKPGGVFAVDAADGHLAWFFDPVSGQNYVPSSPTYNFSPTDIAPYDAGSGRCGGIWTSQSADLALGLVYMATNDCSDAADSPYYEAIFALHLDDGAAAWTYQPRLPSDSADLDYGATPNVMVLPIVSARKDKNGVVLYPGCTGACHMVGEGSKDGTYKLLDAATGQLAWTTRLTVGGNFGGFYSGTYDGTRIYVTSSIGTLSGAGITVADDANKGRVWALDPKNGATIWGQPVGSPTFGQNMAIPGVYINAGLDHLIHAYDSSNGNVLAVIPLGGAGSAAPVVVGGQMFTGANTGSTWRAAVGQGINPIGFPADTKAPTPIPVFEDAGAIVAYCLAADPGCQTSRAGV